jgi:hypothetical protein
MEACCMKDDLSGIICRVLFNNLVNQIRDGTLKYNDKLKEIAQSKLENIRTELLNDYVEKLKL